MSTAPTVAAAINVGSMKRRVSARTSRAGSVNSEIAGSGASITVLYAVGGGLAHFYTPPGATDVTWVIPRGPGGVLRVGRPPRPRIIGGAWMACVIRREPSCPAIRIGVTGDSRAVGAAPSGRTLRP